jgi:hypothetical protein
MESIRSAELVITQNLLSENVLLLQFYAEIHMYMCMHTLLLLLYVGQKLKWFPSAVFIKYKFVYFSSSQF